jgi:nucleolar GTP-binding protein
MNDIANRMHLAVPQPRDDLPRPPQIPESVIQNPDKKDVYESRQREWDEQAELYYEMDPEFIGIKHQNRYMLENPEWNFDKIPEIMDGKNILDFYDPDLLVKLEQLEREELVRLRKLEEELEQQAQLNANFELTPEQKDKLRRIREKRGALIDASRRKKSTEGAIVPRTTDINKRTFGELKEHLEDLGLDGGAVIEKVRARSGSRSISRSARSVSTSRQGRKRTREELERSMTPKPGDGYRNVKQKIEAQKLERKDQKKMARDGRRGGSDRHVYDLKPKHLFSGKSGGGTRDYR